MTIYERKKKKKNLTGNLKEMHHREYQRNAMTGGQSSSGTLNVAPSGGSCVVGEEGDPV